MSFCHPELSHGSFATCSMAILERESTPTHENDDGTPKESQSLSTRPLTRKKSRKVDGFDTTKSSPATDLALLFATPFAYEESQSGAGRCQGNLVSKSCKPNAVDQDSSVKDGVTRQWLVICHLKRFSVKYDAAIEELEGNDTLG
jgi:hypothetical protein